MDWIEHLHGADTLRVRCTALLAFAFVVCALDLAIRRGRSTRWIEYSLLLGAVAIGAGCNAVIEAVAFDFIHERLVAGAPHRLLVLLDSGAVASGAEQGALFGGLFGGVLLLAAGRDFARDRSMRRRVVRAGIGVAISGLAVGLAALVVATISRSAFPWLQDVTGWRYDDLRRASEDAFGDGIFVGVLVGLVVAIRGLRRANARRLARARMAGEAGIEPATC